MEQITETGFKVLLIVITAFSLSRCSQPEPTGCDLNPGPISYNIKGQLVESFTGKLISDQVIQLFGSGLNIGTTEMSEILTDDSGYFAFSGQVYCPNPLPNYLLVAGNEWRCKVQFNNYHDSIFAIPPMAYIKLNLHRIDSTVAFDSLVISAGCCCQLPGVKLLSHFVNATDTTFIKPVGGAQTQTIIWNKYKNNLWIARDSLTVDISGIDTVEAIINF